MYRLIKMSGLKFLDVQNVSLQLSCKRQICNFCRHMGSFHPRNFDRSKKIAEIGSRLNSTSINTAIMKELQKRRKFRKYKKTYAELLEVYGNTSTETKATVRNLRPEHINLLANSPNVTLEHLHEIKQDVSKSQKKLALQKVKVPTPGLTTTKLEDEIKFDIPIVVDQYASSAHETTAILEELDEMQEDVNKEVDHTDIFTTLPLEDPEVQKRFLDEIKLDIEDTKEFPQITVQGSKKKREGTSLKKKTREKLAKIKLNKLERDGREKSFNAMLLAYLNLCESCGYLNRGMATLQHYLKKSTNDRGIKVSDVRIFQVLIHGYASKGNMNKVDELWNLMTKAGLKPNHQAYAARIECVTRTGGSDQSEKQKTLSEVISNMEKDGFSLNDLFEKCSFIGNQRQIILDAVHQVEPSFQPETAPPDICYTCSLLQDINERQGQKNSLKSNVEGLITRDQLQTFSQEQMNFEFASTVKVKTIEKRPPPTESVLLYRKKLEELKKIWSEAIEKGFTRDMTSLALLNYNRKKYRHLNIYPYLKALEVHQYVDLMLQEVRKLAEGSETFSPTTSQLYNNLGHQVRSRFIIKYKKTHGIMAKTQQLYSEYLDWYMDPQKNSGRSCNSRQEWQQLIHERQEGPTINIEEHVWPLPILSSIGKFLYNVIIRDVKIDVNVLREKGKEHMLPAFYSLYRQSGTKNVEEVKPHPVLSRLYRLSAQEDLVFDISELPMLSPPVPWTSASSGGNLLIKTEIIRLPSSAALQWERLKTAPPQQLYPSLDSLNQLGAVPWKVNQPILDIVIDVFNNGGNVKLEIPQPPSVCPLAEPISPDMSKVERFEVYRERMLLRRRKAEMYSLWCDALYRLSLGHHFRDRIFWLPHNMDFRGRVYPCPPHLNHLGSDMARSLLCFAKGEPLGPNGLDWLKIHLINLTGLKKRDSIKDRLDYANKMMPDIVDSAENPLTGRMWWSESEEPWQTLACCKEILAAMQHPEGPDKFVCHYPVHQDGSCNGLQHYAALGRDEAGAFSVNLVPAEKPQDVYSCVAAIVERERAKDAALGVNTAIILDGYIKRKVIKQTVMTTVYGVTRFGARLQIAKQLKDIDSFPKEYVWSASAYLVGKTFESIREMFTSTKEIQDWFTECARLIAQICGQNVEYVTPLGLPVVQPYSRSIKKLEFQNTKHVGRIQETFSMDTYERPNVMKQKNAFPPNFIHSLDSSHMMLTSLYCEQKGITFVSVHDCYWTHPSTVHIMNKVCREQFLALHSEPILQDLSIFLTEKYSYNDCNLSKDGHVIFRSKSKLNKVLRKLPRRGELSLEKVLDSVYFFS